MKHGGNPALLVDFTNALVTLTEISFYCATICGLLGVANEVVCGAFDVYCIFKERKNKENRKKKNNGDVDENAGVKLEMLLMEQIEKKKKKEKQKNQEQEVEMKSVSKEKGKSRRPNKYEELEELLMPSQIMKTKNSNHEQNSKKSTKKNRK